MGPEIPATVGDYIPVEPHMDDETVRYEDEDTPQREVYEGHIEVISEGHYSPASAPLLNLDIPPLTDMTVPLHHDPLSLAHYEEIPTNLVQVSPFEEHTSTPPVHSGTGLPAGYRTVGGVVGEDRPLADLIQFGRVNLNTPATVPLNPSTVTPTVGSSRRPHAYAMVARSLAPTSRVLVTGATHNVGGNPPRVVAPPPGTTTVSVQPHVATP